MQSTWKVFGSLEEAISQTRGNTQLSIGLVKENLYVGEGVEWLATAAVNDFGDWQDGCVVVTDQRVFVAYADPTLNQIYGNMVSRAPVPRISQFQGGGNLATFAIDGLPYQALALMPEHFSALKTMLEETDMSSRMGQMPQAPSEDPTAALAKAKELLDAGLISQDEFDAKKKEILDRL